MTKNILSEEEQRFPVSFLEEYRARDKYVLRITSISNQESSWIWLYAVGPLRNGEEYREMRGVSSIPLFLGWRLRRARRKMEARYRLICEVTQ